MRFLRALLLFELGFWAGLMGSAAVLKRALPSRGDAESDEVALVAIFDGIDLESRSTAFRGASMLSWFGGITVDLRNATLAPGARIDASSLFGGVAIRIPEGWRVESRTKALAGGVAIGVPEPQDPDAPTLTIAGLALFGGIAVAAKPRDAEA